MSDNKDSGVHVPDDGEQSDTYTGDAEYQRKANLLNGAMQEIGMGRYQWALFVVTGFGWFADNLWPVSKPSMLYINSNRSLSTGSHRSNPTPSPPRISIPRTLPQTRQNIGLLIGAVFWGVGSDVWGRRISFNITLLITGVFAVAAGGSPNYVALCAFASVWSIGVGGNLPVDSAIFLEFIPASHQYLLTVLSIWWAFGQLIGSLIAWPLIGNFSCDDKASECRREDNQGWRYFLYAMGGLMLFLWCIRFFLFKLYESPKYLMGRGRDEKAIEVLHAVAERNGKTDSEMDTSAKGAIRRKLSNLSGNHVKSLFATRKLAYSTSLIIVLWALIGLAFPLYNAFVTYFLSTRGADFGDGSTYITYRNQVILSVIGVPGALIAGYLVELPTLGRRGTLSISTLLTGAFILASTTARSSAALLGWNCAYSFTSNVMYGVLYALTPELFPTKDRGTGNALAAAANRVFGIMAPIIALYADLTTSVPIYISGALFLVAGFIALLLPFDSRGKAAL
ncbi:MFS general substrate transporter [Hymenopellis radicata]|nr:MFS general substrate transporter [Hymenopellis radicata]